MKSMGLTFDDVYLIPQYSECVSRSDLDTSVSFGKQKKLTKEIKKAKILGLL